MDAPQLLLGALLFLVPAALLLLGLHRAGGKRPRLPPGPPSLPLLGSVVWLTNSPAEIEPLLRRLFERHGPVVALRVGARLSVFVADRRLAHAALVERGAALADRPALVSARLLGENDNTITRASYGPVWRLLRCNLVAETLHPSRETPMYWPHSVAADLGRRGRNQHVGGEQEGEEGPWERCGAGRPLGGRRDLGVESRTPEREEGERG